MKILFYGIDSWNRPVFREVLEKDNKKVWGSNFFGDCSNLYSLYDSKDEIKAIKYYSKKENLKNLCYFGNHWDCEPMGGSPWEVLEIDVENTIAKLKNLAEKVVEEEVGADIEELKIDVEETMAELNKVEAETKMDGNKNKAVVKAKSHSCGMEM